MHPAYLFLNKPYPDLAIKVTKCKGYLTSHPIPLLTPSHPLTEGDAKVGLLFALSRHTTALPSNLKNIFHLTRK